MLRDKKKSQNIFGPQTFTWKSQVLLWIYYITTFVQLCWHDEIDESYSFLIQFVMFGEFYNKKNVL